MSKTRHASEPAVRGYAVTHPAGSAVLPIEHGWNQLLYAESGAMTVTTADGSWIVPATHALWVPDSAPATVTNRSRVAVRSLYFASDLDVLPPIVRAMHVPQLPRTLLVHAVHECPLDLSGEVHHALLTLLIDQLRALPEAPLHLPWPRDARAVDVAAAIAADATLDLGAVARGVGASRRTLERVFVADTGLTLGSWRRRAHLLRALDALAAGESVTATAHSAGYATPSAFVTAFARELGDTPRRYVGRDRMR